MSDALSAQHPPAMRVGGRRLSVSTRPRTHIPSNSTSPQTSANPAEGAGTDYPRPTNTAQGEDDTPAPPPPPHNEEEAPKKEKKHTHGSHDNNRLKESVHHKLEGTKPSKDHLMSKHSFGASGRIGQPMGKILAV